MSRAHLREMLPAAHQHTCRGLLVDRVVPVLLPAPTIRLSTHQLRQPNHPTFASIPFGRPLASARDREAQFSPERITCWGRESKGRLGTRAVPAGLTQHVTISSPEST